MNWNGSNSPHKPNAGNSGPKGIHKADKCGKSISITTLLQKCLISLFLCHPAAFAAAVAIRFAGFTRTKLLLYLYGAKTISLVSISNTGCRTALVQRQSVGCRRIGSMTTTTTTATMVIHSKITFVKLQQLAHWQLLILAYTRSSDSWIGEQGIYIDNKSNNYTQMYRICWRFRNDFRRLAGWLAGDGGAWCGTWCCASANILMEYGFGDDGVPHKQTFSLASCLVYIGAVCI